MLTVALEGLEFFGYHGLHDFEKKQGNQFIVDIEVTLSANELKDTIDSTIDYEILNQWITERMSVPAKLLETIANDIADKVLSSNFKSNTVKVSVCKLNPPISGPCKLAKVTIFKERS